MVLLTLCLCIFGVYSSFTWFADYLRVWTVFCMFVCVISIVLFIRSLEHMQRASYLRECIFGWNYSVVKCAWESVLLQKRFGKQFVSSVAVDHDEVCDLDILIPYKDPYWNKNLYLIRVVYADYYDCIIV